MTDMQHSQSPCWLETNQYDTWMLAPFLRVCLNVKPFTTVLWMSRLNLNLLVSFAPFYIFMGRAGAVHSAERFPVARRRCSGKPNVWPRTILSICRSCDYLSLTKQRKKSMKVDISSHGLGRWGQCPEVKFFKDIDKRRLIAVSVFYIWYVNL